MDTWANDTTTIAELEAILAAAKAATPAPVRDVPAGLARHIFPLPAHICPNCTGKGASPRNPHGFCSPCAWTYKAGF